MFRAIPAAALLVLVSGFASAGDLAGQALQLSKGAWGWPEGENTCARNPQRITFSQDLESVTFRWVHTHEPATYRVLYNDSDSITMLLDGEDRLTDSGDRVIWQLVLNGADSFCWRRTDWPSHACTPDLRLCPGSES